MSENISQEEQTNPVTEIETENTTLPNEGLMVNYIIRGMVKGVSRNAEGKLKTEILNEIGDQLDLVSTGGTRPRHYVTTEKDLSIIKGWLKARLLKMTSNPASLFSRYTGKEGYFAVMNSKESPKKIGKLHNSPNSPSGLPDQINVRPNKDGLVRLINTMRKHGYIIECKITEPMEEL